MKNRNSISSTEKEAEGHYANYFKIGHNAFEFLLDFGQYYSEDEKVVIHTRIITNPVYAKALFKTLENSIKDHENAFGVIDEDRDNT